VTFTNISKKITLYIYPVECDSRQIADRYSIHHWTAHTS